jgi:putative ABC transport system permease protein
MKHIFRSIIRSFKRKPATNLINLLGLAISFTFVIILSVYCYSELSTDIHQKNGDRIYLYGLGSADHVYTPGILKEYIDEKIPGVESTVRIGGTWEAPVFQVENNDPIISDMIFADENFFQLFTYNFVEGNPETALKEPMTIVITKRLSDKLFGNNDALGKSIKFNNSQNLTVSAVIEAPEANSCLVFSALSNIATRKIVMSNDGEYTEWGWCDFQTFLLLYPGVNPDDTEKSILSLFPEESRKDYLNSGLTPLKKVYFSNFSLFGSTYLISGDRKKVQILLLVASLVMIIALINFINISSSQWRERIKQTGVLKVLGATRFSILREILAESFIFFLTALFIAFELVNATNLFIRDYTGIHYSQNLTNSFGLIFLSLITIIFLSIIFSIIPALKISSSKAVDNLKKALNSNRTHSSYKGLLVALQFAIAITLIAFTVLVQKQVSFGSSNLGFDQRNIIGIKLTEQLGNKKDVLRNLLSENPAVKKISFSQFYPGNINQYRETMLNIHGEEKHVSFDLLSADGEFFSMLNIHLVKGRLFSDSLSSDKIKIVVNEAFLRDNDISDPIGATITMGKVYEIVGVIRDFHYKPVNMTITSLAIRNEPFASYCLVNLQTNDFKSLHTTLNNIKTAASDLSPSFPVEVSFFDQTIRDMYQSELRFRRTFSLFAGCAIVICSLGILAMSILASQSRIKEIGIRKVNGAKTAEILTMLNKDFVKWVAIAFIIATPIAYYIMQKWLNNYAYKTALSWWIFVLAGIIALVIALLTVTWQSWRAASRNPVEALRYE